MPTFQNTTSQESLKVFLNSAHASIFQSDSHVFFHLKDKIHTLNGHHIKLSVLDAEIPFSFYQTNSRNNVLSGSIGGSAFNFTISAGNYTAFEIQDDLNAKFTAASLTCTWVKEPNLVRVIPEEAASFRRRLFFWIDDIA